MYFHFSQDCYCDNSFGGYGTSQFCIKPCLGNTTQVCGGNGALSQWANNVYRTSLSNFVF